MNAFAKYLFQGLFSWVQEAVRQLSDPSLIDGWLARNWLTALIPILLLGTLTDYIVWLLRWRPDLSWRASLDRSRYLLNRENRQLRRFRKGFKDENADIGAIARPLTETADEAAAENAASLQPEDDVLYDLQFAQPAAEPQPAGRHRRSDRYRKPLRRTREAPRRAPLMKADDTPIDGLPPIVSKEEAFRAPVYPRTNDQDGTA